jgi:hypothetical protein
MLSVTVQIEEIIQQVDTARRQAKNHERQDCPLKGEQVEEALREHHSNEDNDVLCPLARTQR